MQVVILLLFTFLVLLSMKRSAMLAMALIWIMYFFLSAGVISTGTLLIGTFNEQTVTFKIIAVILYSLVLVASAYGFKSLLFPGTEDLAQDAMDELLPCNDKTDIDTKNIILQCALHVSRNDIFKLEAQRAEFLTLTTQTLETVEKSGQKNYEQIIKTFIDRTKILKLKYKLS